MYEFVAVDMIHRFWQALCKWAKIQSTKLWRQLVEKLLMLWRQYIYILIKLKCYFFFNMLHNLIVYIFVSHCTLQENKKSKEIKFQTTNRRSGNVGSIFNFNFRHIGGKYSCFLFQSSNCCMIFHHSLYLQQWYIKLLQRECYKILLIK